MFHSSNVHMAMNLSKSIEIINPGYRLQFLPSPPPDATFLFTPETMPGPPTLPLTESFLAECAETRPYYLGLSVFSIVPARSRTGGLFVAKELTPQQILVWPLPESVRPGLTLFQHCDVIGLWLVRPHRISTLVPVVGFSEACYWRVVWPTEAFLEGDEFLQFDGSWGASPASMNRPVIRRKVSKVFPDDLVYLPVGAVMRHTDFRVKQLDGSFHISRVRDVDDGAAVSAGDFVAREIRSGDVPPYWEIANAKR